MSASPASGGGAGGGGSLEDERNRALLFDVPRRNSRVSSISKSETNLIPHLPPSSLSLSPGASPSTSSTSTTSTTPSSSSLSARSVQSRLSSSLTGFGNTSNLAGSSSPSPLRDGGGENTKDDGDASKVALRKARSASNKSIVDEYGGQEHLKQKLTELKDKRKKGAAGAVSPRQVEQILSLHMDDLNITSVEGGFDSNFSQLEKFLSESQKDVVIKEALMQGVELKEYSKQVETELRACETSIVPVYIELRNEFGELHRKISGCVDILGAFETLLNSFQGDLANISDDIKNMQDQSMDKNLRINNRRAILSRMQRYIDDISLPPPYVEQLEKGSIDLTYVQSLASFNRKLAFLEAGRERGVLSVNDMDRKFNVVLEKVIVRVQKFIVGRMSAVKNFGQLQDTQEELRDLAFLYQFLFIRTPDNSRDVKAAYMEVCDKLYTSYFKNYLNTLTKLKVDIATKNDVLGAEDSKLKSFFGGRLQKLSTKTSVFALGSRASTIDLSQPPLDAFLLASSSSEKAPRYTYDELLRSLLRLLIDQTTCECLFVRDFFVDDADVSFGIFLRCAELLLENVQENVSESFDAVGLLVALCLIDRTTENLPETLQHLLSVLERITNVVFSRLVYVFELNIVSIKTADPQDLGPIDIRTHYVTRRYGEFAASILTLYGTLPETLRENIAVCLAKMRAVMTRLLIRLSEGFLKDKKEQDVFLMNNYDLILSLIQHRGVNAEDVAHFNAALNDSQESFVRIQLTTSAHLAQIVKFVDDMTPLLPTDGNDDSFTHPNLNRDFLEALLKQFSQLWRTGVNHWHADIPKLFSNFKRGVLVFKRAIDLMVSYYKQFKTIAMRFQDSLKTSKFIVSETEINQELRNYNLDTLVQ